MQPYVTAVTFIFLLHKIGPWFIECNTHKMQPTSEEIPNHFRGERIFYSRILFTPGDRMLKEVCTLCTKFSFWVGVYLRPAIFAVVDYVCTQSLFRQI
jgi:hypothetical protein